MVTEDHDPNEEPSSQDDGLGRMGIFSLHTEGSLRDAREVRQQWGLSSAMSVNEQHSMCFTHGELVVDLVDVFIDPAMVQDSMEEVVPGVLHNRTAKALSKDVGPEGKQRKVL